MYRIIELIFPFIEPILLFIFGILPFIILWCILRPKYKKPPKEPKYKEYTDYSNYPKYEDEEEEYEPAEIEYAHSYRWRPLLSNHEKRAYWIIKEITDNLNLVLHTKVRLFDLLEPKYTNHKVAQWKIQAKHVDFVICDKNLNAHIIIELDDSSHDQADRQERDIFVDTILHNCGYKVIRIRKLDKSHLQESIENIIQKR